MPITPGGLVYVSLRAEFDKLAYEFAPPSIPVGSDAWYEHGPKKGANDPAEHGSYGWRQPDLVKTEDDQRAVLSRYAAMPDKYAGDGAEIRGLGDWIYQLDGSRVPGDLGRPLGWKWGDEAPVPILDDGIATNSDGSHCRYGPLWEILRADAPAFMITATIPGWSFPVALSSKHWAAYLLFAAVRTFAGQLRHPYLASPANPATNEPDRHNVLILDFVQQAVRAGLLVNKDMTAAGNHLLKVIDAFSKGLGVHGEPRTEVGGLFAFQTIDCLCYAPFCLYQVATLPGIAKNLSDPLFEIVRRRSVAHVQAWTPGQPYPYWIGVPGGPSTQMDQITGMVTWFDPLVPHGYEPWARASYDCGAQLGVPGCAERRDAIDASWKGDAHARARYLVNADRSLAFP